MIALILIIICLFGLTVFSLYRYFIREEVSMFMGFIFFSAFFIINMIPIGWMRKDNGRLVYYIGSDVYRTELKMAWGVLFIVLWNFIFFGIAYLLTKKLLTNRNERNEQDTD